MPPRRTLLAALLAAALTAACAGDDAADTEATGASAGAAAAGDPVDAPEEAGDADDVAAEEASDGAGDGTGPAAAGGELTWLGETSTLDRVTCGAQPGVGYVVRASDDDLDLAVVYDGGDDPTDPTYDFAAPDRVELYRGVPGGSIGDGEGYLASPELDTAIAGVTGSESGAAGTLSLVPDDGTTAPDVNPGGGELTFSITC